MAKIAASVYLDTNFLIWAVESTKESAAPARKLIVALRENPGVAVTSEISFAEVLAPSRQADALPLNIKRRTYLDLLLWSKFIRLVPVSRNILIDTADLRVIAPLKLPDAIHLASAIHAGCRFFVSADKDFRKLPGGMEWINSDEGIARLTRELS